MCAQEHFLTLGFYFAICATRRYIRDVVAGSPMHDPPCSALVLPSFPSDLSVHVYFVLTPQVDGSCMRALVYCLRDVPARVVSIGNNEGSSCAAWFFLSGFVVCAIQACYFHYKITTHFTS